MSVLWGECNWDIDDIIAPDRRVILAETYFWMLWE